MLVIRLSRTGRTKRPHYRLVVADKRAAVKSSAIEVLGHYDPRTKELVIDEERAKARLAQGAQPSETVEALLDRAGVLKREAITEQNRRPERQPRKEQGKEAPAPAAGDAASEGEGEAETPEDTKAEAEAVVEEGIESGTSDTPAAEEPTTDQADAPTEEVAAEAPAEAVEEPANASNESTEEAPADVADQSESESDKAS